MLGAWFGELLFQILFFFFSFQKLDNKVPLLNTWGRLPLQALGYKDHNEGLSNDS